MEPKINWITGNKFAKTADYIYAPDNKDRANDDYYAFPNTFSLHKLKDGDVIYTPTMYVERLFNLLKCINGKFTILTHNSDLNISNQYFIPDCINKWFSTNVNCVENRLFSIPIGLENERWFIRVHKKEKMIEKLKTEKYLKNLVYVNHNILTNPPERSKPYEILKDKTWVTMERGRNGSGFDEYIDNVYNHPFVVCPEGNGLDTHRTWETLYMGSFPIEKRNLNNKFYEDLPICFINDWEELTEDFLQSEFIRLKNLVWNKEKLSFDWWQKHIRE